MEHAPLRVIYGDDSWLVRQALAEVLARCDGVEVLAICEDGDALLAAAQADRPDVVLTDMRMPPSGHGEGLRISRSLAAIDRSIGVLVLSQYAEPAYGLAMLEDGVDGRGYLLKDRVHNAGALEAALRAVASGSSVFDPAMIGSLVERRDASDPELARLTPRERDVLAAMAQGKSNASIAESLVLTKKAVEKHVSAIFSKLSLPGEEIASRRVAAVLRYLGESPHPGG
ncbi:MAG TPA: response regulator transcription factor [Solirubrobacteraceae bacterium]|nr:response regulator transcription factor [Solirubrobacteraceae bacterium]